MKRRNVKPKIVSLLFIAVFLFLSPSSPSAQNMSSLISSLYNGNGVNLLTGAHQGHFTIATTDAINELNGAIADGTRQFPLSSSGGGFTFQYDPQQDTFVRTSDSLGPIMADRAQTLGQGKIITGFAHSIINFNRFEGKNTTSLRLIAAHQGPEAGEEGEGFLNDVVTIDIDLSVRTRIDAFYFTYGLTNNLDVGVFIPLLSIDIEADALASLQDRGGGPGFHAFGPPGDNTASSVKGSTSGLGDVLIRFKYFAFEREDINFAVNLDVKTPTGDEDDLLGTGETTFKPSIIISKSGGKVTPHLNLGYEYETGNQDRNAIRYTAGFDMGSEALTLAVDVIGIESVDSDRVGKSIIDGAIGVKYNPGSDFLFIANLIFPLNGNSGLRADFTPTIGFESIF